MSQSPIGVITGLSRDPPNPLNRGLSSPEVSLGWNDAIRLHEELDRSLSIFIGNVEPTLLQAIDDSLYDFFGDIEFP